MTLFSGIPTSVQWLLICIGILVIAGLLVAGYAFYTFSDAEVTSVITDEWKNVFFGWDLTAAFFKSCDFGLNCFKIPFWYSKTMIFSNLIKVKGAILLLTKVCVYFLLFM